MCETLVKRIVSMMLIIMGIPRNRITELTGMCDKSIRTLQKKLENGEINEVFHVGGGSPKRKLADVETEIIKEVNENEYHSQQQIADMVQEKFGIKVSAITIGRLLKKKGVKRLKSGSLPAKADTKEQRSFYETVLHPLMDMAKMGTVTLLFMDASHFVMGCDFLGYVYGFTRRLVRTFSGRKRYNVLGALNFVSKKVTTVVNDTYITSTEICELLIKLAAEYTVAPICLVLDNARYQKCAIVEALARELGIALTYIPAYSPNLNLIERLWKHVKSKLRTKHYEHFDGFKEKIDSIICGTNTNDKHIIDKLIGEKVQLYDDIVVAKNPIVKKPVVKKTVVKNKKSIPSSCESSQAAA